LVAIASNNLPVVPAAGDSADFLEILENWNQGIAIRQGERFVFVNHAFAEMCGYESREAVLSLGSVYSLVAEGERERISKIYAARIEGDKAPDAFELQFKRKDGSLWWAENRAQLINWNGEPAIMIAISDISESKRHAHKFRALLDSAPDAMVITDADGRITELNEQATNLLGFSRAELIGQPVEMLVPERYAAAHGNHRRSYLNKPLVRPMGQRGVLHCLTKSGEEIPVDISLSAIDTDEGLLVATAIRDISERLRVQAELEKSEAAFRGLLDGSSMGIFIRQGDRAVYANEAYARLYGYERAQDILALESVAALEAPAERQRFHAYRAQRDQGSAAPNTYEFEGLRKDGTSIWLENHVQPISWYKEPALLVIAADISERRRAREALRKLNQELELRIEERTRELASKTKVLETTFSSVSEGFVLYDADDRLVMCNDAYRQVVAPIADIIEPGVAFETVTRAMIERGAALFPGETVEDRVAARMAQHRDPGPATEVELGDGRWLLITERRTDDGGTAIVQTDISKLKQTELASRLAQARLADAIESLPMSFVIYDADDRVLMTNRMYEETFPALQGHTEPGTPVRELLRRNLDAGVFSDAVGHEDEWLETRLAQFRDGTPFSELRLDDGRILRAIERPTWEGGTVSIRVDITEHRKIEQALIEARQVADNANQAKSEFLSSMSHELRTPLNAIMGFAQVLRDYSDEPLTQDQNDSIEHILGAGNHLLGLINEVLDLSRIEAGRLDFSMESVDLAQAIQEGISLVRPLADAAQIDMRVDMDAESEISVSADPSKFKQALLNLLSNAVKYNREGGTVTVAAVVGDAGLVRINVSDTGPGIPAEKHDEVFRPFSRLGAEASKIEGTGIGLTISRQLIENMGGSLDFESTPGAGSTFWLELPLAELRPSS
jgi:PAS domain S-box-containing protein